MFFRFIFMPFYQDYKDYESLTVKDFTIDDYEKLNKNDTPAFLHLADGEVQIESCGVYEETQNFSGKIKWLHSFAYPVVKTGLWKNVNEPVLVWVVLSDEEEHKMDWKKWMDSERLFKQYQLEWMDRPDSNIKAIDIVVKREGLIPVQPAALYIIKPVFQKGDFTAVKRLLMIIGAINFIFLMLLLRLFVLKNNNSRS